MGILIEIQSHIKLNMLLGLVFWGSFMLVSGGRSPHADYVEELVKNNVFVEPLSDNIIQDALLDLPCLVRKYNYPFEEHSVTTRDGYILGMHRIPHGRDMNTKPGNKSVVFLMHGLTSSSADFITMGPGTALAYILAEEGYDVWLGNARGNYFSRRHTRLRPDGLNTAFWQFSWDEIGNIDLPAMIDYVLQKTGKSGLHYIGHSQGTTAFFVMGSLQPAYNNKIISMHAMGPVAYLAHNRNRLFRILAPFARDLQKLASLIGIGEFLPRSPLFTMMGLKFCNDRAITQPICSHLIFSFAGRNEDQHNSTMLPVILGHTPAGASVKQIAHYGQSITDGDFKRYDFGALKNLRVYGRLSPPRYDLSRISAPVFLHYTANDPFADVNDVNRLFSELGNVIGKFRVPDASFNHVDFIWGIDARTLLFDRMINFMRIMDSRIRK